MRSRMIVRTDKGYELSCSTPGVSYVYKVLVQDTSHWDLYHEPIEAEAGKVLSVKACRAGFTTSETVTVRMK